MAIKVPVLNPTARLLFGVWTLTGEEIRTLFSLPVEIPTCDAAPGEGAGPDTIILPISGGVEYIPGSVAFDQDALIFISNSAFFPMGSDGLIGTNVPFTLTDTTPRLGTFVETTVSMIGPPADFQNTPMVVAANQDPGGSGDGSFRVTVVYMVLNILNQS